VGNREDEPEGIEKLKTNHHGQATARRAAVAKKQTVHDQIQNMGERLRAPTIGVVLRRRVRSGGGRKRRRGKVSGAGALRRTKSGGTPSVPHHPNNFCATWRM
jgi:hypothetical protein